jgi:hypothetical protein
MKGVTMNGLVKVCLTSVSLCVLASVLAIITSGTAHALDGHRNCNDDAIVRCGAGSLTELLEKYDKNVGDVQAIYRHYGISRSDISGQTSEVKYGTVYQDGRIVVDGKVVATNAYSLSRVAFSDKNGTPPRIKNINGTTLYEGPNMSIFVRTVDIFAFFRDGEFYKGIISSCGNPLVATPKHQPKPQPKPEKPIKPQPKPEKPVKPEPQPEPEETYCPVEGKEHLPEDSPECVEEQAPIPELPKTGLGTFVGGSIGIGSITAAGYYWAASRRNLLSTLLQQNK